MWHVCVSSQDFNSDREALLQFGEESSSYGGGFAQYFHHEEPPGWYLGRILLKPKPRGVNKVWINYSEGDYDQSDDLMVDTTHLTQATYKHTWVLVQNQV